MADESETSKNAAKKEAKKLAKKAKKLEHKADVVTEAKTDTTVVYCCAGDPATCTRWAASVAGVAVSFVSSSKEEQPWMIVGENVKLFGDLALARWFLKDEKKDALERALIEQWCDFSLSYPSVGDVKTLAKMLEDHLKTNTYVAGSALSLADIALAKVLLTESSTELDRWRKLVPKIDVNIVTPAVKKEAQKEEPADSCPPLEKAVEGKVVTRFPPEPSGYLHIGHAKALLLNDYYAKRYKGKLLIRFDDTNPSKEKGEYAENILKDVETLLGLKGLDDGYVSTSHTSDHFDHIKTLALKLIQQGDAFMDDTDQETMRKEREELKNSKYRDSKPEENVEKFEDLCKGTSKTWCLRAKIDMQSPNGTLRDPVIYRSNETPHHRTGTKYKAYPTYDLACPIVDSLEGVTHALRTTEYGDRDAQYEWFIEKLKIRPVVIHSFSRINFVRTLMSKRKLAWLVDEKVVDGWDDPRFPTIQGVKRRGVSMESLREFIVSQGASRNVINLEWDSFWALNKAAYEPLAHRFQAVEKNNIATLTLEEPLPEVLSSDNKISAVSVNLVPKDATQGLRAMRVAQTVYIENEDAVGLKVGDEIVLMRWGVVKITAASGLSFKGIFDKDAPLKKKKPLHFLAKTSNLVDVDLAEYDYLITKPKLEEDEDLQQALTPVSKVITPAYGDPGLKNLKYGDVVQLERRGFYICDQALPVANSNNGEQTTTLRLILIPDGKAKMPFSRLPSAIATASKK